MRIKTPRRNKFTPTRSSELKSWTNCRQRWFWEYSQGIQKRKESLTIRRGVIGHAALAVLDSTTNWSKTYDNAGISFRMDTEAERVRVHLESTLEDIEFEGEILSSEEARIALNDVATDVKGQCWRYANYWPRWEKVEAVEKSFMFRLPGAMVPIHLTLDLLVWSDGELWISDHKFVKQFRDEEQFALDWQVAIYTMAARAHGFPVAGFLVDQIAPTPKKPELNKPDKYGKQAMSRTKVGDWPTYRAALLEAGLDPADYADMEEKLPACSEFRRYALYRTDLELLNLVPEIVAAINEVASVNKTIYKCNDQLRCKTCQFQELCVEQVKGGDVDFLMATAYQTKLNDQLSKYQEDNNG